MSRRWDKCAGLGPDSHNTALSPGSPSSATRALKGRGCSTSPAPARRCSGALYLPGPFWNPGPFPVFTHGAPAEVCVVQQCHSNTLATSRGHLSPTASVLRRQGGHGKGIAAARTQVLTARPTPGPGEERSESHCFAIRLGTSALVLDCPPFCLQTGQVKAIQVFILRCWFSSREILSHS